MEWIIIVLVLSCVAFLIWNITTNDKTDRYFSGLLLIISTFIFTICLDSYLNRDTPSAINVYRGKTTLEITYRDSIPVDSVVVFKDEFKK